MKQKTIDGVKYTFISTITYKDKNIIGFRSSDVNVDVIFKGNGSGFSKKLSLKDLEKLAGSKLPETIVIVSVSFKKDDYGDKMQLEFFVSNKLLPKKITFDLIPDDNGWTEAE